MSSQPVPVQTASDAPASAALLARASEVIPGGVNSPVRAFRAVGGTPRFMASGAGPWLTDADGKRYVDLICSWGPMILGHAHPEVLAAVTEAAAHGFSFGTPSENEVRLAEEIVARVEPVEQVRLVNSGTEATMSAIRLARGFTGRDVIVKFAGCYHGHVDALLASAGSGVATFALPDSAGVPRSSAGETIVLPYNDLPAARGRVRRARARDRRRHHRGRGRQHGRRPAGSRLHRGPAARHQGARRAARLRRGDDRLPLQRVRLLRPRGAVCRRGARPLHLRQGHGRRLPDRGLRRPRRRHGAARAAGARLPGRHAVR